MLATPEIIPNTAVVTNPPLVMLQQQDDMKRIKATKANMPPQYPTRESKKAIPAIIGAIVA